VLCRSGQNVKAPPPRAITLPSLVKYRLRWALAVSAFPFSHRDVRNRMEYTQR
jgi:hypothetical protein